MIEVRRIPPTEDALAAVAGGAVTRDRLEAVSGDGGGGPSPLVSSLLSQGLPRAEDIARVFSAWGSALRLEGRFMRPAPGVMDEPGLEWMRRFRCMPVELMPGIAVIAVVNGAMEESVRVAREVLGRDVVPVPVADADLERAFRTAAHSADRRAIFRRFRDIAVERSPLDPITLKGAAV